MTEPTAANRNDAGRKRAQVKSDPALHFLGLLWEVHHGLQKHSKRMEREVGLTGPQRLVLRFLDATPGMIAGDLAAALHLDASTLTGIVRRLVRAGNLRRTADPHDRRRFLLVVTLRGRAASGKRAGTIEERVSAALAQLPAAHTALAEKALELIARELHRPLESRAARGDRAASKT